MVYSKGFADKWDALVTEHPFADETEGGGKPEFITKASDLIFPDQSNVTTVEASLKDIQISRGTGGSIGKALGIKSKTTHFKLDTSMGYRSIHDLRIVHAKDEIPPLKVGVTEPQERVKARTIKQFNPYTNRASFLVSPLPVGKEKA
jgi:hypothetical protein